MSFLSALKSGNALEKSAYWKKVQLWLIAANGFAGFVVVFYPQLQFIVDNDLLIKLSIGFEGLAVMYLTVSTTDKIGI